MLVLVFQNCKLHMYETYFGNLQPHFWQENLQLHCMDSVTKDTPIRLKEIENIKNLIIDELANEEDLYVDNIIVTSWGYKEFADWNNF